MICLVSKAAAISLTSGMKLGDYPYPKSAQLKKPSVPIFQDREAESFL